MTPEMYFGLMLLLTLIIGLCIGSFMNVVIYRLPRMIYADAEPGFSIAWPPSHCPVCHGPIRWYDNIPLISWLLLAGKCRHCRTSISALYPLTELLTGLWFAGWFILQAHEQHSVLLTLDFFSALLPGLLLFCLLYCICVIDIQHYLIPDSLSYSLLWSGLLFSVLQRIPVKPAEAVIGCIVIWLVMSLLQLLYRTIRKIEGLGSGDIKLFAAAMPWLGLEKMPALVMISALAGAVIYGFVTLYRRYHSTVEQAGLAADCGTVADTDHYADIDKTRHFPFGPSIALAILILFCFDFGGYLLYL